MSSVYSTPVLTPLLRRLSGAALRLAGWKTSLHALPVPPYVLIGAPHTSNWDFALMVCALLLLKQEARWLGKTSLFAPPFGGVMSWLGGIPVDRSQPRNAVAASAKALQQQPALVLCIAPEGTRKKVNRWRTGFYYMALQADVPIVMVAIDAPNREIRLLGQYRPTGNADRDIAEIQRSYCGFSGIVPENSFELQDQ